VGSQWVVVLGSFVLRSCFMGHWTRRRRRVAVSSGRCTCCYLILCLPSLPGSMLRRMELAGLGFFSPLSSRALSLSSATIDTGKAGGSTS